MKKIVVGGVAFRTALLGMLLLLSSGCATIISGTTQDIAFSSVPTKANVKLNDGAQTVTPGKLTLKRKEHYTATFTKESFPDRQAEIKPDRMGNWWVLGNILFGGIIGIVVDIISGAQHHLAPEHVIMDMTTGALLETLPGDVMKQDKTKEEQR
jgi:uncharacterized protein YceK